MRTLNYLCEHDISDDDCYRCEIHGIRFGCSSDCPDFKDVRKNMSAEVLNMRGQLMMELGVEDRE